MLLYSTFLLILAASYAAVMGRFAWGLRRVTRSDPPPQPRCDAPLVSVVVAARNEEDTIQPCLQSILQNDYPDARFEVIVVDDFSDDATPQRVEALQHKVEHASRSTGEGPSVDAEPRRLRLVRLQDEKDAPTGHKHDALRRGLDRAQGDILLTTDADCTVGPGWIRAMSRCFTPQTAFVSGPVCYDSNTVFGDVQALEALGLVALGAGAIGGGRPNLCNSANVAYRRSAYERWGHDLPSSPAADEMLIQRVAASDREVVFCAAPTALVRTRPASSLNAFWAQRRRWARAGGQYPDAKLHILVAGVYAFYLLLFGGLILLPFWPTLALAEGCALALKVGGESALLTPACRHFDQTRLLRYFLPAQLVQIPYVVAVGAAGQFGAVRWKGRSLS